jgi:hypothetical protein
MDIGEEQETVVIEPIEAPGQAPAPIEEPEPVEVPVEAELAHVGNGCACEQVPEWEPSE